MRPPPPPNDEGTGECQLLGAFAILIQGALGALALLSLVYKRWRERPQRPVKIWAFDASKQVVGSVLLHLANLVMSMFSAGQIAASIASAIEAGVYLPNPCSFYLLNLAIDTTLGIPILIILLRLFHAGFRLTALANPPESIQSGNYGDPPRYAWWMKQSLIYFLGLLGMKICVFILFQLMPWLGRVGDWALRWTEGNEAIQIAFVMLIFPLIMNAMQYYIIDIFIKKKQPADEAKEDDPESRTNGFPDEGENSDSSLDEQERLLAGRDEHGDVSDDDEVKQKISATTNIRDVSRPKSSSSRVPRSPVHEEYVPERDGEQTPKDNLDLHEEDKDLVTKVPQPTE